MKKITIFSILFTLLTSPVFACDFYSEIKSDYPSVFRAGSGDLVSLSSSFNDVKRVIDTGSGLFQLDSKIQAVKKRVDQIHAKFPATQDSEGLECVLNYVDDENISELLLGKLENYAAAPIKQMQYTSTLGGFYSQLKKYRGFTSADDAAEIVLEAEEKYFGKYFEPKISVIKDKISKVSDLLENEKTKSYDNHMAVSRIKSEYNDLIFGSKGHGFAILDVEKYSSQIKESIAGLEAAQAGRDELDRQESIAKQARNERTTKIVLFVVFTILIISIVGIVIGLLNKAVYYNDVKDLAITFSVYPSFIVTLIFFEVFLPSLSDLAMLVVLGISCYVFWRSYLQNNKNVLLAIVVGISKLTFSFIYVLKIFDLLNPSGNSIFEKRYNRQTSMIVLAMLTPLLYKLINGETTSAENSRSKTTQKKQEVSSGKVGPGPETNFVDAVVCPACGENMSSKRASNGKHKGRYFWVCNMYPTCKKVIPKEA